MRPVTNIIAVFIGIAFALPVLATTNLSVPFTPQAPHGNWSQPWQDACEEATVVMVDYFYSGHSGNRIRKNEATKSIRRAYDIKTKAFGYSLDENANKIVSLINNFYGWEAKIVENPNIEMIKNEVNNNRPVILPTYGKALYNKYFHDGGPQYHTVVISGYDDETKEFITQEPGTRHGLDFRYSYDRIMNAMHDFVPGKTKNGKKVAIFTSPSIKTSGNTDGDKDGLSKIEELKNGTVLWLADSDGDGYTDGEEVQAGYLPTVAENQLPNGSIVKTPFQPDVYLIENGEKRHIKSEKEFISNGFKWSNILTVSSRFIDLLRAI